MVNNFYRVLLKIVLKYSHDGRPQFFPRGTESSYTGNPPSPGFVADQAAAGDPGGDLCGADRGGQPEWRGIPEPVGGYIFYLVPVPCPDRVVVMRGNAGRVVVWNVPLAAGITIKDVQLTKDRPQGARRHAKSYRQDGRARVEGAQCPGWSEGDVEGYSRPVQEIAAER